MSEVLVKAKERLVDLIGIELLYALTLFVVSISYFLRKSLKTYPIFR
jgi:hypothetical protein